VWVARKVPSGYVTGHANQARITTFPLNDPDNSVYSPDVISFARKIGLYTEGSDESFSFSDVYDPVTFEGARFCEARVWSFFSHVMGYEWSQHYLDYVQGVNLTNRMPLWVKPAEKLSAQDVMESMRNHYEGTALDNTGRLFSDIGAGQFHYPNRISPITWSSPANKGELFFHERTIAQSPTGWSIVCQSRPGVPRQMAALLWFGIDDSSTSVHFPIYGSATRIPKGWAGKGPQDGVTPPLMHFSLDSAFYVFNLVANWAYSRWDAMYPDVYKRIIEKETLYLQKSLEADKEALQLFTAGKSDQAVEHLTSLSDAIGTALLQEWFQFFGELFVKYRDGFVTTASPLTPVCGCSTSSLPYSAEWYDRIVADTGDRYLVPQSQQPPHRAIKKLDLKAFR
jgi:dipeptidase